MRSRAWIWLFSSTHSTSAALGRVQVQPDHVAHLLDEERIGRQLERLGQVRLEAERPPDAAHRRLAHPGRAGHRPRGPVRRMSRGGSSKVLTIIASTRSSAIVRGRPSRSSSDRPSSASLRTAPRHLHTVCGQIPSCSATSLLVAPSAHASTIGAKRLLTPRWSVAPPSFYTNGRNGWKAPQVAAAHVHDLGRWSTAEEGSNPSASAQVGGGRGGRVGSVVDRARWGASGALYPQSALAGLNSCPRVRVRRERRARSVDGQVPRNVTL